MKNFVISFKLNGVEKQKVTREKRILYGEVVDDKRVDTRSFESAIAWEVTNAIRKGIEFDSLTAEIV